MRVDYLPRFDRSFKKVGLPIQEEIQRAIGSFLDNISKGTRPQGLGLRRLRDVFWEIRVGLQYRVLFEMKNDWVTFLFVGNHNEVKRFLKSI